MPSICIGPLSQIGSNHLVRKRKENEGTDRKRKETDGKGRNGKENERKEMKRKEKDRKQMKSKDTEGTCRKQMEKEGEERKKEGGGRTQREGIREEGAGRQGERPKSSP